MGVVCLTLTLTLVCLYMCVSECLHMCVHALVQVLHVFAPMHAGEHLAGAYICLLLYSYSFIFIFIEDGTFLMFLIAAIH